MANLFPSELGLSAPLGIELYNSWESSKVLREMLFASCSGLGGPRDFEGFPKLYPEEASHGCCSCSRSRKSLKDHCHHVDAALLTHLQVLSPQLHPVLRNGDVTRKKDMEISQVLGLICKAAVDPEPADGQCLKVPLPTH